MLETELNAGRYAVFAAQLIVLGCPVKTSVDPQQRQICWFGSITANRRSRLASSRYLATVQPAVPPRTNMICACACANDGQAIPVAVKNLTPAASFERNERLHFFRDTPEGGCVCDQ